MRRIGVATVYEGNEPYIFVSYSHKDKTKVIRYIDELERHGFLLWFDEGIEAGSEWPDYIAKRLADSMCVLAFISSNFVESRNCRQELTFSQELGKEQLNVYIEQVELPMGMRMQLGLNQAIRRNNFQDEESFISHLCKARLISDCKKTTTFSNYKNESDAKPNVASNQDSISKEKNKVPVENLFLKNKKTLDKKAKIYGWICSLIEFAYIPISVQALNYFFDEGFTAQWMILFMAIPHIVIALINKLFFFKPLGKKYKQEKIDNTKFKDVTLSVLICFILATIISIVCCTFFLNFHTNFLLRLLISVGLNIIPFFIAGLITLFLDE